jgi:hypothetical protein
MISEADHEESCQCLSFFLCEFHLFLIYNLQLSYLLHFKKIMAAAFCKTIGTVR